MRWQLIPGRRYPRAALFGATFSLMLALAGCKSEEPQAKDVGSQDADELRAVEGADPDRDKDLAIALGYVDVEEMRRAPSGMRAEEFASRQGYQSLDEMRKATPGMDAAEYARSLGFPTIDALRDAASNGIDSPEAYEEFLRRKADPYYGYPELQRNFIGIVRGARDAYDSSMNEVKVVSIMEERNDQICRLFKGSYAIENWQGTVESIDVQSDQAVIEIDIADNILLANNFDWQAILFQGYQLTSIEKGSGLFRKLGELSEGGAVVFSGRLFRFNEQGECLAQRDRDANVEFMLTEPEFVLELSDIAPRE